MRGAAWLLAAWALGGCGQLGPEPLRRPRGGTGKGDDPWGFLPDTREVSADEQAAIDEDLGGEAQPGDPVARAGRVVIPVAVHVMRTGRTSAKGNVGESRINHQIEALNASFAGEQGGVDTGFRFELQTVDRRTAEEWFHAGQETDEERAMKASQRRGGASTLNLYVEEPGDDLLGYSTFPFDYAADPDLDGVVLLHRTLPGGDEPYDLGMTAVHEVGHWLGLFHTFYRGCDGGDSVRDTAPEAEGAEGCPIGRDTCSDDNHPDPVTNYMDYSDDACVTGFTQDQAERMHRMWRRYRADWPG